MDDAVSRKSSTDRSRDTNKLVKPIDLDDVLVNELGQFGWFQLRNILLVAVPVILSGFSSEYIFSAAAVPHRCRIPECGENNKSVEFEPDWILDAVPATSSGFASCERFAPRPGQSNGTLEQCPADLFDTSERVSCEGFVYARDNSVVYDFDLGCQEWLRALAGTFNNIGVLLVLPFIGYISDRFGRRMALVISGVNLALFGLLRVFSVNYAMYLVLQVLQTTFGGGTYSSAYIFATELVGPKYRVVTGATSSSIFAIGQVTLGAVAWVVQPWRSMIVAVYAPCLVIVFYYWIMSESIRWLLSKRKYDEARKALENIARVNMKHISEESMNALMTPPSPPAARTASTGQGPGLIKSIMNSPILLRRVCTTPIWWVTMTFVYYGLSINSVGLSDTMYLNYILTCAIEIPGFYTAAVTLDRVGRKPTLFVGYFLSAACNIAFAFIPNDLNLLRMIVYLLGKFGISIAVTSLYLYTSELYPTEYRHSLLAFSSMIGRIGSITAPLTPVLKQYWDGLPSIIFGVMGMLSGVLVLTQPETLGTRMPDTLAEAEALIKSQPLKRSDS